MALADLGDINVHLPDDKLEVDTARYAPYQLDAERIVRGFLAGYITPVILAGWTTPETTPQLIRAIAGRLVAAFYYRERYSEDSLDDPQFAQVKYNEAISWLMAVKEGTLTLEELEEGDIVGGNNLTTDMFAPNDDTLPAPFFTMGMTL